MVDVSGSESAYIGLGANVGATREALTRAVSALDTLPGTTVTGVSALYRTRPVGPVFQADFLNAVVGLHVPAGSTPEDGAMRLLIALKAVEQSLGRVPREHWGPREVDLDLLLFGSHRVRIEREDAARSNDPARVEEQWLQVPHPEASQRLFVLAPLADLVPELKPPGWGMRVDQARDRAERLEGADAVARLAWWDREAAQWR